MADEQDDWGFTNADHDELQSLMRRTDLDDFRRLMIEIVTTGGVSVSPDDPFIVGTQVATCDDRGRIVNKMFPPGGMWRELLIQLRAFHRGERETKGGA